MARSLGDSLAAAAPRAAAALAAMAGGWTLLSEAAGCGGSDAPEPEALLLLLLLLHVTLLLLLLLLLLLQCCAGWSTRGHGGGGGGGGKADGHHTGGRPPFCKQRGHVRQHGHSLRMLCAPRASGEPKAGRQAGQNKHPAPPACRTETTDINQSLQPLSLGCNSRIRCGTTCAELAALDSRA